MADSNVREYTTATDDPEELAARLTPRAAGIRADPGRLLDELRRDLTDNDRMIVSDAGLRSMLLRNYREGLRTSADGWIDDVLAFSRPWGFDPADIRTPVMIWHGELDVFSPSGTPAGWPAGSPAPPPPSTRPRPTSRPCAPCPTY